MNNQSDLRQSKEQELALKELDLTRREIELAKREADLARWEADQNDKEEAQAKEEAQIAEDEKNRSQEELEQIRREIEAAEAKKQAVLAEIKAAEKRARAAEAEMEAKQAEAEKEIREKEAEEKERQAGRKKEEEEQAPEKGEKKEAEEEKKGPEKGEKKKEEAQRKEKEAKKPPEAPKAQAAEEEAQPEAEKEAWREEPQKISGRAEAKKKEPGRPPKKGAEEQKEGERKPEQFKDVSVEETLKRLDTSRNGLSAEAVKDRLEKYGHNELEEKKESAIMLFLSYFRGTIPYMIMAAALISAILHHIPTLLIILALLFLNAVIGFREEHQAGNAIEALKQKLAVKANAKRDGKWQNIEARDLVPGDIVRLRIGSVIPADAKLLEGDSVKVDQSALTGESMPVEHRTGDIVYSGSILKQGEIDAAVTATGTDTYYGKTAQLVQSAKTKSHLQIAIMKMADYLLVSAIVLAVVIIAVEFMRTHQILEVLQFVLVLIVAAVPVAMPAVLSVTMALGASKLAEKQAVVTKLSAVEEVAGVDILCTDKTGTLTKAQLSPGDPFTVEGVDAQEVILCGALASREEDQDPIDLAVLSGIKDKEKLKPYSIEHFMPFDPVHKRTEAAVKGPEREFKTTKGAPQVILALDPKTSGIKDQVDEAINDFARRGFRSLGVARSGADGKWRFIGIIPLYDPLRDDTKSTIESAQELGLEIKMVTGDQLAIAKEIARQLDLGTNIVDAAVFGDTKHHEGGQLADAIEEADGFAQVFPEHKYHIVDVLQQRGHIVGMTGDGVNDAPALKKADAGIAVSGATDAARSAASIALLDPGLSVIIHAVRESRRIFERMLSYAVYRIAETLALLGFITIVVVGFNVYPVTPIMIVFLAILNDGSILSIAYDNTRSAPEPLRWKMVFVMGLAGALGSYAVIRSLGILFISAFFLKLHVDLIKTMIYLNLSVGGILTLYAARTRGPFWSVTPAKPLLVVTLGAQVLATIIAVYGFLMTPIGWYYAGFVWGYSLVLFILQDRVKLAARKVFSEEEDSGYFGRHSRRE